LDLDDEKAIDYSSNDPFLPFEALGDYVFDIVSYTEFEGHNGDGDMAILKVVSSSNPTVKAGERYAFLFPTDTKGDGKAFAAARLRSFIMAAVGVEVKDARAFQANKARKDMLEEDYSAGGNLIALKRGERPAKATNKDGTPSKHAGKKFSEDTWSPHKAA